MKYGSVCSGIEAASVAWEPLGWVPAWFAEVDAFPSAVLAHHWPHVDNLGDMNRIARRVLLREVEAPDVLVGGTPCQAFSVAGMCKGLADERGQLTIKFVELANEIDRVREQPAVIVWENVPGVLSSKDNAFGCFLGALAGEDCELQPAGKRWADAGCVYGPQRTIAWRILDAQYFGLAQRRRRVFVVASARTDFDPAAVLFEREGVRRDTAPRRETREEAAGDAGAGLDLRNGAVTGQVAHTVQAGHHAPDPGGTPHVMAACTAVRRLTPTECERLQGFPDGHTAVPYRNKPAADGPRYKAIGNSMAVPVMRWIGERIKRELEVNFFYGAMMNKQERIQAAEKVRNHVSFMDEKAEVVLDCGMIVRFKNDAESRESVARKLEKGYRTRNPRMPESPVPASTYDQAMKKFIADGEIDNAREYARLHGKEFSE